MHKSFQVYLFDLSFDDLSFNDTVVGGPWILLMILYHGRWSVDTFDDPLPRQTVRGFF